MKWSTEQIDTLLDITRRALALLAVDPTFQCFPELVDDFRARTNSPHNVGGIASRIYRFGRSEKGETPKLVLTDEFKDQLSAYVGSSRTENATPPAPVAAPVTVVPDEWYKARLAEEQPIPPFLNDDRFDDETPAEPPTTADACVDRYQELANLIRLYAASREAGIACDDARFIGKLFDVVGV